MAQPASAVNPATNRALVDKVKEVEVFASKRGLKAIPWQQIIQAILAALGGCGLTAEESADHIRRLANGQSYFGWRLDRVAVRRVTRQHAPDHMEEVEATLYDSFDRVSGTEVKSYSPDLA